MNKAVRKYILNGRVTDKHAFKSVLKKALEVSPIIPEANTEDNYVAALNMLVDKKYTLIVSNQQFQVEEPK